MIFCNFCFSVVVLSIVYIYQHYYYAVAKLLVYQQFANVSQKLEADKYATLGLLLPLLVRLTVKLDEQSTAMKNELNNLKRAVRVETDRMKALVIVIDFAKRIRNNLIERFDPFNVQFLILFTVLL